MLYSRALKSKRIWILDRAKRFGCQTVRISDVRISDVQISDVWISDIRISDVKCVPTWEERQDRFIDKHIFNDPKKPKGCSFLSVRNLN